MVHVCVCVRVSRETILVNYVYHSITCSMSLLLAPLAQFIQQETVRALILQPPQHMTVLTEIRHPCYIAQILHSLKDELA